MQDLKWKTKNIENTKKKYFRSLVDRGPPQRRKIRMENQKKIEKTKKTKKQKKIRSLVDRGHPQRVLEYCFFFVFSMFFFGFLRVFLLFSKGPSPKSLGILFVFLLFFCFFCFSRVFFFVFFCFLKVFFIFSKGPSPKSLGIVFFSRVFFWFTQGFFFVFSKGPSPKSLGILLFSPPAK